MQVRRKILGSVFDELTDQMDVVVSSGRDPHTIADRTAGYLEKLLAHPDFLEERFREPDHYRQHARFAAVLGLI